MESMLQSIAEHVCRSCLEANLTEDVKIQRCSKCGRAFCTHFASSIDPQYCVECLSDIELHKEIVTKTYEALDSEGEVMSSYKRTAKSIRLSGFAWLFAQRKIVSLSDTELELSIEYHREILTGMLSERETRKAAYAHRMAGVKVIPSEPREEHEARVTKTKTTKVIRSSKKEASAKALLEAMLGGGMDLSKMIQMLEQKAKKKEGEKK